MSFTNAQKVDVRRYCGYAAYGAGPSGFQGWRFFQAAGLMEYRLNNMAPEEETVVTTYLTNLNTLEAAVPSAAANLDTDSAAVWKHNKDEVRDRLRLYDEWRKRLCQFLGVPPGPYFSGSSSVRLVV